MFWIGGDRQSQDMEYVTELFELKVPDTQNQTWKPLLMFWIGGRQQRQVIDNVS